MKRYLAIWVGVLFVAFTLGMAAQVASGNVAESSNPREDVVEAQNFPASRTIGGCVVQQGSDYLLVPRHGRPEVLTGANLGQIVGHEVKVQGHERYAEEGANPVADYAMAAEKIESVSASCPAGWNDKWARRTRP